MFGLPLMPSRSASRVVVLLTVQRFAPSLHTVEAQSAAGAAAARRATRGCSRSSCVVAGGVREEIQRAFLLHRFERLAGRRRRRPGRDEHRVRRRPLRLQGVDAGDRDRPARRVLGRGLPAAAIVRRADGQPRRLRSAADRAVSRLQVGLGNRPQRSLSRRSARSLRSRRSFLVQRQRPARYRSMTPPRRRRPAIQSSISV